MALSDLLSSSRGPGIIGTLIAILVLGGFGTLFVVFDKNMQDDGVTLQALVREQGIAIESRKEDIEINKKRIKEGRKFADHGQQIASLQGSLEKGAAQVGELEKGIEAAQASIEAENEAWNEYKVAYRNQVWKEAVGSQIEELKGAKSGKVYLAGKINDIGHTGISVTNAEGIARIPLEDLSPEVQERYQLDLDLANAQRANNNTVAEGHLDAVALAELKHMLRAKTDAIESTERQIDDLRRKIGQDKETLANIQNQIRRMPGRIRAEERKPVSQVPKLKAELRTLQNNAASRGQKLEEDKRELQTKQENLPVLRETVKKIEAEIRKKQQEIDAKAAAAGNGE